MAVSINEGVRYPVSVAPQAAVTHPNFRGADTVSSSNVLEKSPSTDIVEISSKKEKKKGLSTGAKWGIGLGITALGALAIYGLTRGKAKPKKQFWDNIKEVQVEKDLKFTEFKDKNEALKFAKEKLKLENIDENMSVEALNDIIDTFIDIANKNNGKIVVPSKITQEATDKYFASVAGDIKDNNFGTLTINKDLYDVKKLEENLKSQLFKDGAPIYSWNNNGNLAQGFLVTENIPIYPEDLSLLKKYYNNEIMSFKEKQNLLSTCYQINSQAELANEAPLRCLEIMQKDFSKELNKLGLNFNINEISSKTLDEQRSFVSELSKKLRDEGVWGAYKIPTKTMKDSLFHEYGHLADLYKNKSLYQSSSVKYNKHKLYKDDLLKLQKYKYYKDLPEFHGRKEQEIAAQVSVYAQASSGEFIAETFAGLMKGKKYSKEVMALYEKYGGPVVG